MLAVAEDDDVAVSHNIVFAFEAKFSFLFGLVPAAQGNKIFIGDNFGLNKFLFKISVDNPGGLFAGHSFFNCPGATFLLAGGIEAHKPQSLVGSPDKGF